MNVLIRKPDIGYLDSVLYVPKSKVNAEGLKRALTFQTNDQQNPLPFTLYKETEHHLLLPREFWLPEDFLFPVVDCRPQTFPEVEINSRIQLDHEMRGGKLVPTGKSVQQDAMRALLQGRGGVLQLACGSGKTVVALDFIARRRTPALILLDTEELIRQWSEEIAMFLDVPGGIGLMKGKVFDWKKSVVIATYHSLAAHAKTMPEEVRRWFGTIVWDEAHHVAAPTFSRSADLFYGYRLGLTATPDREDGRHVIYNFHIGPTLYKNLKQDLKPRIYFIWTGLALDPTDTRVQEETRDVNGELHIGKVAAFLGKWPPRIQFVLDQITLATAQNRKVLVLSKSVDALVNLLGAWNKQSSLYSDIPFPTAQDVGETEPPVELEAKDYERTVKQLHVTIGKLAALADKTSVKAQSLQSQKNAIELMLTRHEVWKKCAAIWNKKRSEFLKQLLTVPSTAGLMIHKVPAKKRGAMLRAKQVTFAISKYGREGLNEKSLDTVLVLEPIRSRGSLQQLMGRVLRALEGKKEPVVVFFEDDIGPFIGMCTRLRQHLREWSPEDGGPFHYELLGHPTSKGKGNTWTTTARP
jgi:superfamily II DNA or RNA helicase